MPQVLKSWNFTTRDNQAATLSRIGDQLMVGKEETITLQSLFESYDLLSILHLDAQAEVFNDIAHHFPADIALSSKALHVLDFWNLHDQLNLENKEFNYTTIISGASRWNLKFNRNGLKFHDIDNHYGASEKLYEQNLADFWFYGPALPIPDPALREQLVQVIRNALYQHGVSHPDSHFPLMGYPSFIIYPDWVDGDYVASNFVILRSYGIEYGRQNFHDGLVWLSFLSYEQCLTRSDFKSTVLTQEILGSIRKVLKESHTS